MKMISLDNGHSYKTAEDAIRVIVERNLWDTVVNAMDDATREAVAAELAPCTMLEFLDRYLQIAPDNLIIG